MTYRADIDGLRALAVLAVIGFHAFPEWFPGGFVGVDIFFVVSGYLISQQLFTACDESRFSITDFYVRRIRRIVPALSVVLAATAVFGWFALAPQEFALLQKHLAASAFFSNNLVLWKEEGYFDVASELKPLLHLWSLGIEEQFYLVWPLLIWWCWRQRLNRTAMIAALVVLSFFVNVYLVTTGHASSAFYLPHTRLWQLGAGALLAATPVRGTHGLLTVVGLVLCAGAIALASSATAYPGWAALAPTAGALLVIAAGARAFVNRAVLGHRALVWIGLISYPWYLWHWPMLVFLHMMELGTEARAAKAIAIAISFVAASATFVLIERPVRRSISIATPGRAVAMVSALFGIGAVAVLALATGTLLPPGRVPIRVDGTAPRAYNEVACRNTWHLVGGYCQQFIAAGVASHTVLLGDSHAAHFFTGLGQQLADRGDNLLHVGQTQCPPLLDLVRVGVTGDAACARVNRDAIEAVATAASVQHVLITFRGSYADSATTIGDAPPADGGIAFRLPALDLSGKAAIVKALADTVAFLHSHGKQVSIILPTPELPFQIQECTGRPLTLSQRPLRSPCGMAKADVLAQQASYRLIATDLAASGAVQLVDPLTVLCDDRWCAAVIDGQLLFSDDNHLGDAGSARAARAFAEGRR